MAIVLPTVVPAGTDADGLNLMWDQLLKTFDDHYNNIYPESQRNLIQKSYVDWQEFYFGKMGIWDDAGLTLWRNIYATTAKLLLSLIPSGSIAEPLPYVAPKQPAKADDTVFYVSGKPPAVVRDAAVPIFSSAVNWNSPLSMWLLLGIPAGLAVFYLIDTPARRRRRHRRLHTSYVHLE